MYSPPPDDQLELLFLGTGTSAGVPMIGCKCEVCTSADPHDKRTRASVIISYGDTRVLVDTTPELRLQCVANDVERIEAIVFTHAHADHIMGLDDVRRFNAIKGGPLDLWAEPKAHETLQKCFGYAFRPPPVDLKVFRPELVARNIDGPFSVAGVEWKPIRLMHGTMEILGFRIGKLAYCTDVSLIPDTSFPLLEDLDVLVLDGLQHKKHPTHFNLAEAIEAAHRIKAKETWFTHIAHGLAHEKTNGELPPGMKLSHDGLRVMAGR